jgi:hypothetical protein
MRIYSTKCHKKTGRVQDGVKPNIPSQVLENRLVLGMVTRVHNDCIVCCFKLVTSIDSYAESAALEASLRHIRCLLFWVPNALIDLSRQVCLVILAPEIGLKVLLRSRL